MDDREAQRIAWYFFNNFLELKLNLDSGKLQKPKDYDKELSGYKRANEQLRKSAQDLADDNKKFEEALALGEERERDLRRQVNELTINLGLMAEKLEGLGVAQKRSAEKEGYSFVEHMDPESRRLFEQLMKEVPYRGTHGGD